jgi:hypothetical protein
VTTRIVAYASPTTSIHAQMLLLVPSAGKDGTCVPRRGASSSTPRTLTRPSEVHALAPRGHVGPRCLFQRRSEQRRGQGRRYPVQGR